MVTAAALVTNDLASTFGLECLQLMADGEVRRRYVDSSWQPLLDWAAKRDVPITDATAG